MSKPKRLQLSLLKLIGRVPGLLVAGIHRTPLKSNSANPPARVQVSLAEPLELLPYTKQPAYNLSTAFLREAAKRRDVCVVTYVGNELAAYGWVAYHTAPHVNGITVRFGAGHRYSYKALTLSAFRGQRLRGSFGVLSQRDAIEGVTHSLCFIDVNNEASIRSEHRNGGRLVGYAGYLRLGKIVLPFRSPGAKQYGFDFVAPN